MKIKNEGWYYTDNEEGLINFFKKNHKCFPRFGGDVETLF